MDRQELLRKLAVELENWGDPPPKGFKYYAEDREIISHWDSGEVFTKSGWLRARERLTAKPSKPEAPEWDGEGAPPVGVECEWSDAGRPHKRVLIMGYYGDSVWLRVIEGQTPLTVHATNYESFRPIRSEEERRTDEAMQIIDANPDDFANVRGVIQRMIAAGYRKQ